VNPLYYVTFTTCTLCASFILFRGFNTTDAINTISLLCGFLTIFTGVYLLNLSREDPNGQNLGIRQGDERGQYQHVDGIPTDGLTGLQTRLSMQARRSGDDGHRRSDSWSLHSGKFANGARKASNGNNDDLIHNYDIESNSHNLARLAEDSDEEESPSNTKRTSFDDRRQGGGGSSRNPSGTKAKGGSKR
jgi:hypothetical protein